MLLQKLLAFTLLAVATVSAEDQRPNILYIMSDDHAVTGIGAYGGRFAELDPTPNIDKLAAEGIRFDNCFVTNSICTPSRAAIMTSQYAHLNGCYGFNEGLDPSRHTLAQEFKKLGYHTAVIGKWHLLREPAHFDYYAVLDGQGNYFNPIFRIQGPKPWPQNTRQITGYDDVHSTDAITGLGLNWLKSREGNDKPFFMVHQYKAPHDNFINAERYDWYLTDVDMPEPYSLFHRANHGPKGADQHGTSIGKRNTRRNMGHHMAVDESLSPDAYKRESYQRYMKKYFRCVKGVDDGVGEIIAYLKETGQLDNTIIVYSGDQGFMLGEHDYIDKRWMYEESMKAPFIVRYPEVIKAGSTNDDLVINLDFAPTLLEMAGLSPEEQPGNFQGQSLVAALKGEQLSAARDAVYYRYWLHMAHHDNPAHLGIRTKTHKLILFYGLPCGVDGAVEEPTEPYWELYDISKDPTEMNNLIGNVDSEELFVSLKKRLKELRTELGDTDPDHPQVNTLIDTLNPYEG